MQPATLSKLLLNLSLPFTTQPIRLANSSYVVFFGKKKQPKTFNQVLLRKKNFFSFF